jgi:hypothetical protein
MTGSADLERRYSSMLALYPAEFRREHEAEVLSVLMESATDGQRHVHLADAADLIRGALTLRLRIPGGAPRTVVAAVRLMCVGAAVSLAGWITTVVTEGSVRAAMARSDPARWPLMLAHTVAVEVVVPATVIGWLWLAWANGHGRDGARRAMLPYFGLTTLSAIFMLGIGAGIYAPADLASLAVLWLVELSVIALVFNRRSVRYYQPAGSRSS